MALPVGVPEFLVSPAFTIVAVLSLLGAIFASVVLALTEMKVYRLRDAVKVILTTEETVDLELGVAAGKEVGHEQCKKKRKRGRHPRLSKLKYFFLADAGPAEDDPHEVYDASWVAPDCISDFSAVEPYDLPDDCWLSPHISTTSVFE